MATVIVTALYDEDLNFFPPNGELKEIDVASIYLGTKNLPALQIAEDNTNEIPTIECLVMKDPTLGTLYLNMTLAEWNAAVTNVTSSGNATSIMGFPITYFVPDYGKSYVFNLPDDTGFNMVEQSIVKDSTSVQLFNANQIPYVNSINAAFTSSDTFTFDGNIFNVGNGSGVFQVDIANNLLQYPTASGNIFSIDGTNGTYTIGDTTTGRGFLSVDTTAQGITAKMDGFKFLNYNGDIYTLAVPYGGDYDVNLPSQSGTLVVAEQITGSLRGTGDVRIDVPANTWLLGFAANPTTFETIKVGTTPGGNEILAATLFTPGRYTAATVHNYFDTPTTIYVSGAVGGNVDYQFHF